MKFDSKSESFTEVDLARIISGSMDNSDLNESEDQEVDSLVENQDQEGDAIIENEDQEENNDSDEDQDENSKTIQQLKEENEKLKESLNAKSSPEISEDEIPDFIKNLDTFDKIEKEKKEFNKLLDLTNELLEDYKDAPYDELIEFGGEFISKREIQKYNRDCQKALIKFIPAQELVLNKKSNLESLKAHYQELIKKEVPEVFDKDSEIGKLYDNALKLDPIIKAKKLVPELAVDLDYIIGHALRSITSTKKLPKGSLSKAKTSVSSSGGVGKFNTGGTANNSIPDWKKTGSVEDFADFIASKIS